MQRSLLYTLILAVFLDIGSFFVPIPIFTPLFLHSTLLQIYSSETRYVLLGAVVASYGLAQLFGSPILGKLSDQYGRKKIVLTSMAIAAVGCLLSAISLSISSVFLIFISRILIGFASGNIAIVFAIAADYSNVNDKPRNLGYINAGLSAGAIMGPMISGHLIGQHTSDSTLSFAIPFYCMALLYTINIIFISKLLPSKQVLKKQLQKINLFTIFRSFYLLIISSPLMCLLVLSGLFAQIGTEAFYLAAPIIGVNKFHMSVGTISNYFILYGIVAAVVSWWVNAQINRLWKNSRYIYFICILLYATTIISLYLANSSLTFFLPFLSVSVFGVLSWIQINNLFSQSVSNENQGMVFGISQSLWSIGGMIGTFLVGFSSAINEVITSILPFIFITLSLIFFIFCVISNGTKDSFEEGEGK